MRPVDGVADSSSAAPVTVQVLRTTRSPRALVGGLQPRGGEQRFEGAPSAGRAAAEVLNEEFPTFFHYREGLGRTPDGGQACPNAAIGRGRPHLRYLYTESR